MAILMLLAAVSLIGWGQDTSRNAGGRKVGASTQSTALRNAFGTKDVQDQAPVVGVVDEKVLREYTGMYQWDRTPFRYLMWNEFTGFTKPGQLVAFDESGDVRALYRMERDRFFAGPGASVPASIESRVECLGASPLQS